MMYNQQRPGVCFLLNQIKLKVSCKIIMGMATTTFTWIVKELILKFLLWTLFLTECLTIKAIRNKSF